MSWTGKRTISDFEKNAFKLFSGAAIAQFIPWLISPLLTRLYSPEAFGLLTILLSILAIGNTINTGKYEVAIYLPKEDEKAWALIGLNGYIAIGFSIFLFVVFLLFGNHIMPLFDTEGLGIWFYLIPAIIFFMGIYKIVYSWLNRLRRYTTLAVSRVVRALSMSAAQVSLGLAALKTPGLIIGQVFGEICATIYIVCAGMKSFGKKRELTKANLTHIAKEYSGFPKYSLPGDFINSVTNQIPVFLFSSFFGAAVVGQYGLTFRILSAPVSLLASAILDVFKQKASEDFAKTGSCREIFLTTLKRLTLFSLPVFLIIGIFGPVIFVTLFGKEWMEAGRYAQILSILFFVRFIVSPLSYVLYIAQKQKVDLLWQISLGVITSVALGIGIFFKSTYLTLWLFTLSYTGMYLIYLYLSYIHTMKTV